MYATVLLKSNTVLLCLSSQFYQVTTGSYINLAFSHPLTVFILFRTFALTEEMVVIVSLARTSFKYYRGQKLGIT